MCCGSAGGGAASCMLAPPAVLPPGLTHRPGTLPAGIQSSRPRCWMPESALILPAAACVRSSADVIHADNVSPVRYRYTTPPERLVPDASTTRLLQGHAWPRPRRAAVATHLWRHASPAGAQHKPLLTESRRKAARPGLCHPPRRRQRGQRCWVQGPRRPAGGPDPRRPPGRCRPDRLASQGPRGTGRRLAPLPCQVQAPSSAAPRLRHHRAQRTPPACGGAPPKAPRCQRPSPCRAGRRCSPPHRRRCACANHHRR